MNIAPAALSAAAACYCYADKKQADSVEIMLLAQLAGNTQTPSQLAASAKCYCYSDKQVSEAVKIYLLVAAATAAGA